MKPKTYKMRAECLGDALEVIKLLPLRKFKICGGGLPDVTMEFSIGLHEDRIREMLHEIPDSHVMRETLAPLKEYTGIRK